MITTKNVGCNAQNLKMYLCILKQPFTKTLSTFGNWAVYSVSAPLPEWNSSIGLFLMSSSPAGPN